MKVLITGASGFIGFALTRHLLESKLSIKAAVRSEGQAFHAAFLAANVERCIIPDIDGSTDWSRALDGVDVVIHTAARVHVMRDRAADPLEEFRRVNTAGTQRLACQAVHYGVRRLVFLSSVKVNGESTPPGASFRESDEPNPVDPYAVSKWESETALKVLASETPLETVVVRPTLVYGAGVGGNMATMLSWAYRGIPLPLGAIANERSFISLGNLCSLLHVCATHPAAAGETFLASDGRGISTPQLLRAMAAGMGKQARLYPVPVVLLQAASTCFGLTNVYLRLCQSLVVDVCKAEQCLGWRPPISIEDGIEHLARWYSASVSRRQVAPDRS